VGRRNRRPIHLVVCNAAINPEIALLQTQDHERRAQLGAQTRHNYLADETKDGELQRPSAYTNDPLKYARMLGRSQYLRLFNFNFNLFFTREETDN
jgi:hypothetical protein